MKLAPRERRLLQILGGIAAIALLRFLYLAASPPDTGGGPGVVAAAGPRPAARPRGGQKELPTEVVPLDTDRLEIEPHDLSSGRDPFRYGPPPPPPPPPPPTAEELERRRREEEERLRRLEEARRLALIPKPPPVTLVYLGSFGPERRRIAVFTDESGENLYNARAGDVVEEKFIVDRIGYESVDLKFVGFPDEPAKRLPIGG
ncbi:MAG: hypothetical protein AB7G12_11125 [Thermoanaerobaculia bacterium]